MLYRYRNIVQFIIFIIIAFITFRIDQPSVFVDDLQLMVNHSLVWQEDDLLYQEIVEKSPDHEEEPQDAYIDRVWKKTPGRNGLIVNVEKSYEKMKQKGIYDEALLVYEQVSPRITLADLPPAPIYRGHPEKDMVAFLINVSWGTEHIPTILKTLKDHSVRATFFIEGKWAQEHAHIVKMIDEQGHLIGNHAYNHPDMNHLSEQDIHDQIQQTNQIIKAIIEKTPTYFAPPSGSYNDRVVEIAHELNMETILWTVDTIDWKNPSVSVMIDRVINNIHSGAMILMHPTTPVANGLDVMIKEIKDKGYRISTIDSLLSDDR